MDKTWFKKWFGTKEYLELYHHRNTTDAAKIAGLITRRLKLPKGSRVLDLACGNGRHSVYFAAKGYDVLGLDLSEYLISQANRKLKGDYSKYKQRLTFEIRDMRYITHRREFDLVVNLFSSFGYFNSDAENFKVIKSISGSLKPNGYFFFDFLNAGYIRKNLVHSDISVRNHNVILQVREIKDNSVYKSIYIIKNNTKGKTPAASSYTEMIKLYTLADFKKVFAKNGLKILNTYGDYSGRKFEVNKSERLIILAQKSA